VNAYIREDQILPRLPARAIVLGAPAEAPSALEQSAAHAAPAGAAEVTGHLQAAGITLTYDPGNRVLRAGTQGTAAITLDRSR
jgi:hypothetical protein